ncbi:MAG: helix-turn-helix domain-containing protein [Synergistaceae bacterium]|nr:helix-turn-helix domain-containing protein [Synergistaceae bacterium]
MIYLRGEYLKAEDAAKLLGYSVEHVTMLCVSGQLQGAVNFEGEWVIPLRSVCRYKFSSPNMPRAGTLKIEKITMEVRQALNESGVLLSPYGNYYTAEEAAERLGVSRQAVIELCQDKKFDKCIAGRDTCLIPDYSLKKHLRGARTRPRPQPRPPRRSVVEVVPPGEPTAIELHGEYIMSGDAAKMLEFTLEYFWRLCRTGNLKSAAKAANEWLISFAEVVERRNSAPAKRRRRSLAIRDGKLEIVDNEPTIPSDEEMRAAGIIIPLDGSYYTVQGTASAMCLTENTVRDMIRSKEFGGVAKLGNVLIIPVSSVESCMRANNVRTVLERQKKGLTVNPVNP